MTRRLSSLKPWSVCNRRHRMRMEVGTHQKRRQLPSGGPTNSPPAASRQLDVVGALPPNSSAFQRPHRLSRGGIINRRARQRMIMFPLSRKRTSERTTGRKLVLKRKGRVSRRSESIHQRKCRRRRCRTQKARNRRTIPAEIGRPLIRRSKSPGEHQQRNRMLNFGTS